MKLILGIYNSLLNVWPLTEEKYQYINEGIQSNSANFHLIMWHWEKKDNVTFN